MRKFRNIKRLSRVAIGLAFVMGIVVLLSLSQSVRTSGVEATPICSTNQITVAVQAASGVYAAAGNEGVAFAVINVSHAACSLEGYPKLHFYPSTYKAKSIKVTDNGGGQIFAAVSPRRVVIKPGATASYGINYLDAYNQGDPISGPCKTQSVTVRLPVRPHPYSLSFTLPLNLNFCFTNFHFGVTSIQPGPLPKTTF